MCHIVVISVFNTNDKQIYNISNYSLNMCHIVVITVFNTSFMWSDLVFNTTFIMFMRSDLQLLSIYSESINIFQQSLNVS